MTTRSCAARCLSGILTEDIEREYLPHCCYVMMAASADRRGTRGRIQRRCHGHKPPRVRRNKGNFCCPGSSFRIESHDLAQRELPPQPFPIDSGEQTWSYHPYPRRVVARIKPLRSIKGEPPPIEEVRKKMLERAAKLNREKIKPQDLAGAAGRNKCRRVNPNDSFIRQKTCGAWTCE